MSTGPVVDHRSPQPHEVLRRVLAPSTGFSLGSRTASSSRSLDPTALGVDARQRADWCPASDLGSRQVQGPGRPRHRGGGPRAARHGPQLQLVHIFPDLTVQETLEAAVVSRLRRGARCFASLAGDREVRAGRARGSRSCSAWPAAPHAVPSARARRQEAPGRGVGLRPAPRGLLLDEPTSGVSTADKTAIMEILIAASRPHRASRHRPGGARHGHRLRAIPTASSRCTRARCWPTPRRPSCGRTRAWSIW